jgi:hypothetical protein
MHLRIASLLVLPLVLGACTVQMRLVEAKIPDGAIAKLHAPNPIAVRPRLVGSAKRPLSIGSMTINVDEDQFSSELVNRVLGALRAQSVPLDPDAARSVELQVVRVALQPDSTFLCVVDFNRRLGDGRVRGLQSRSRNWNYETACAEALSQAVADTLSDPDTRAYLEGN